MEYAMLRAAEMHFDSNFVISYIFFVALFECFIYKLFLDIFQG